MVERNITLDYFKLLLSVLVVLIHLDPLFENKKTLCGFFISNGICRLAVPCFFIINGYLLGDKITSFQYLKKYLKKLLIIFLVWSSLYISGIPAILEYPFRGILLLLFGVHHLWYISALIIAVILYFLLIKIIKSKKIVIIAFLLFSIGYFLQYYLSSHSIMNVYEFIKFRNGLFLGLPLLIIGNLMYSLKKSIKVKYLYFLLLIFSPIFCLEIYLYFQYNIYTEFYFSQLIICPSLLFLVLRKSKYTLSDGFIGKLSESIYFIHPISLQIVFTALGLSYLSGNKLVLLPLILFISLLLSVGIIELNKRIKIFL